MNDELRNRLLQRARAAAPEPAEDRPADDPRPGDLFVFPETAEFDLEWALIEIRGEYALLIPADDHPIVGGVDVDVEPGSDCGELTLRGRYGVMLALARCVRRTGVLPEATLTEIRARRAAFVQGVDDASPAEREADAAFEMMELERERLAPARDALLRLFAEPVPVLVRLHDPEADDEELDERTRRLLDELLAGDFTSAHRPAAGPVPAGARAAGATGIGALELDVRSDELERLSGFLSSRFGRSVRLISAPSSLKSDLDTPEPLSETEPPSPDALTDEQITRLLIRWSDGDDEAIDQLFPLVVDEMRTHAKKVLAREAAAHRLRTTELVNEVIVRLLGRESVNWQNREHFFGTFVQLMRRVLIDQARRRKADKREGVEIPIEETVFLPRRRPEELIALDDALLDLARVDERQSKIVELRIFAGLKLEEVADVLGVSPVTVSRDWKMAKMWLARQLRDESGDEGSD